MKKEWGCLNVPTMFKKYKDSDNLVLLYITVFKFLQMKESIKQLQYVAFKWTAFRKPLSGQEKTDKNYICMMFHVLT